MIIILDNYLEGETKMILTKTLQHSTVKVVNFKNMNKLVRQRLHDLGVVEGSIICLSKKLPFGGPCTIETKGQSIAIRRKEAMCIEVEPL